MGIHLPGKSRTSQRSCHRRTLALRSFLILAASALALGIMPLSGSSAAGAPSQPPVTIGDRFGIASSHLMTFDEQTMNRKFQAMDELQAGWVRCTMAWHDVEGASRGNWNLDGCDMAVKKAGEHGVKILGILGGSPLWANESKGFWYAPTDLEAWKTYIRTMATRYRGKVAAWEIWNEENFPFGQQPGVNPAEYVNLLRLASAEIRAADPGATIVMGGMAGIGGDYLWAAFNLGALNYVDAIAYHPYPNLIAEPAQPPEAEYWPKEKLCGWIIDAIRDAIARCTTKPVQVWITEVGWSTLTPGIDYDTQAAYTLRTLITYAHTNIDRVIWYMLRDEPPNVPDKCGLMTYEFDKKTSYYYYATFKKLFGPASGEDLSQASFSCTRPATLEAHCFPLPDGRLILSAWKSDNLADSLALTVNDPSFGTAMLVDPASGSGQPVPGVYRDASGRINVQGLAIGKTPVIIELAKLGVTSINPNQVSQLTSSLDMTVSGSGFGPGTTVRLEKGSTIINTLNLNVASDTQITCTAGFFEAEAGSYDLVVADATGHEARLPGAFTVTPACGAGSGAVVITLGLMLGIISLAGTARLRRFGKA